MSYFVVRLRVDRSKNRAYCALDLARRQVDHLGRAGIESKRKQTDRLYRRKGYLRFKFVSRKAALELINRLKQLGEPTVKYRLMRNPNSWRY